MNERTNERTNANANKKIALFNAVQNGGETCLNYLKPIAKILQEQLNYDFDVFQYPKEYCGLTLQESQKILNHKVELFPNYFFPNYFATNFDILFCNHQTPARYFPNDILYVSTNHGNSPMPLADPILHGQALIHNDVIFCYGKASQKMLVECIQMARQHPKVPTFANLRSKKRKTYLPIIKPLKNLPQIDKDNAKNNFENLVEKYQQKNLTIGFLPTSVEVLSNGVSMINHVDNFVISIVKQFPLAKYIFRPYFPQKDANSKDVFLVNFLQNLSAELAMSDVDFQVDISGGNVSDFYAKCDVLISDGSTGGISFLMNKQMPPIYYFPRKFLKLEYGYINRFIDLQKDKVLFAHNMKELIKQISNCINFTPEQRLEYFENCQKDWRLEVDNAEILQKIIAGNFKDFPYVDEEGNFVNI